MNVTAYQEKEKNKKTRTSKRRAGEERKQATDFREAVLPFCGGSGGAQQKNEGECPG